MTAMPTLAIACCCAVACHVVTPIPPDPGPGADCDSAGARLTALWCPEQTSPKGAPFAAVCRYSAEDGRPMPVGCISAAGSCEEARQCR